MLLALLAATAAIATAAPDPWRIRVTDLDPIEPHSSIISNNFRVFSTDTEEGWGSSGGTVRMSVRDYDRPSNYYFMQLNGWEYVYYQHLDEAIPPEFWGGTDRYFTDQVGTKAGYARFWEETAIGFDEPFRSYAAERLERNPRRSAHP